MPKKTNQRSNAHAVKNDGPKSFVRFISVGSLDFTIHSEFDGSWAFSIVAQFRRGLIFSISENSSDFQIKYFHTWIQARDDNRQNFDTTMVSLLNFVSNKYRRYCINHVESPKFITDELCSASPFGAQSNHPHCHFRWFFRPKKHIQKRKCQVEFAIHKLL